MVGTPRFARQAGEGGAPRLVALSALVALAGICASVAESAGGTLRTCALLAVAVFVLWAALILLVLLADRPSRLHERYLRRRYGIPVPFASGQLIVGGRSLWTWACPYCGRTNRRTERCSGCAATFDGRRRRVKRS